LPVLRQNHETGERFADLLKWGLIRSLSKDRPKPIAAKARTPQRGGANEDRRNEAGGAREGHEGAGDVSVAPGLIEKATLAKAAWAATVQQMPAAMPIWTGS
jgi:hypothetical protein